MGIFKRLGDRLSEGPEQLRAQEIRLVCSDLPGVEQIAVCRPRSRPKVAGVVQSVTVDPRGEPPILKIEVFDGTDHVVGVWYGRRSIPGISLGKPLILQGTMRKSSDGDFEMINPSYELVST